MNHAEATCPLLKGAKEPGAELIKAIEPEQDFVLSQREAKAASPEYLAVCGEEDPGEGLEFLVTSDPELHFHH